MSWFLFSFPTVQNREQFCSPRGSYRGLRLLMLSANISCLTLGVVSLIRNLAWLPGSETTWCRWVWLVWWCTYHCVSQGWRRISSRCHSLSSRCVETSCVLVLHVLWVVLQNTLIWSRPALHWNENECKSEILTFTRVDHDLSDRFIHMFHSPSSDYTWSHSTSL